MIDPVDSGDEVILTLANIFIFPGGGKVSAEVNLNVGVNRMVSSYPADTYDRCGNPLN